MARFIKLKRSLNIPAKHIMADHKKIESKFERTIKQFMSSELPIVIFANYQNWQKSVNLVNSILYYDIYTVRENETYVERLEFLHETVLLCAGILTKQTLPNLALYIADNAIQSLDHSLKTADEIYGTDSIHQTKKFTNIMLLKSLGLYGKSGLPSSLARQICPTCKRYCTIKQTLYCRYCIERSHSGQTIQSLWRGYWTRKIMKSV